MKVVNADSFTVARGIVEESHGATTGENDKAKITVLNLASDARRVEGWEMTHKDAGTFLLSSIGISRLSGSG